jgi:hypothetical protein
MLVQFCDASPGQSIAEALQPIGASCHMELD